MTAAALIRNPAAGRRDPERLRDDVCRALCSGGFDLEVLDTEEPGHAVTLARCLADDGGTDVVFTCGGDGTLREVATGLLGSEVAMAPLPNGTVNVLAHALGVPGDARAAAEEYARGRPRRSSMDVGLCGGEPFLMMVSAGLDAIALEKTSPSLKRLLGRTAVGIGGARALLSYGFPEIDVVWNGNARKVSFFSACNIPFYGGTTRLAPDADWSDGELDLVLLSGRGRRRLLGFAAAVTCGSHLARPDVESVSVPGLRARIPDGAGLQLDGDPIGNAGEVEITVAPSQLALLLPPESEG